MEGQETPTEITIKTYRRLKQKLQKLEMDNFNTIYLIPCSGNSGWYELAEHSALIYYYEVCQKLELKAKLIADTLSFYDQYHVGYMRSLGIDNVCQNLKRVKLFKSITKENNIYAIELSKKFSPNHLEKLWQAEKDRRLKNLTIGETNNLDPELHQLMVASSIRLHRLCNAHLDRLSSQINGAEVIKLIDGLLGQYHQLTLRTKTPRSLLATKYDQMRTDIYMLIIEVKIIGEAKLWDSDVCISVSENLYTIRERIEKTLAKIMKESKHGNAAPSN